MSGIAWIILDIMLLVGAIGGTIAVRGRPQQKPLDLDKVAQPTVSLPQPRGGQGTSSARLPGGSGPASWNPEDGLPPGADLSLIWKQTLFLPSRMEMAPERSGEGADGGDRETLQAQLAAQRFEFELIGISRISGPTKESPAIALMRSKAVNNRGARNRGNNAAGAGGTRNAGNRNLPGNIRNSGGPGGMPQRGGPPGAPGTTATSAAPEKEKPLQLIFKVGDLVGETGYTVKAIYPEKRMVELARSGEVIRLTISYTSAEAAQRREAAAQREAKQRQAMEAEQKRMQQQAQRNTGANANNNAAAAAAAARARQQAEARRQAAMRARAQQPTRR